MKFQPTLTSASPLLLASLLTMSIAASAQHDRDTPHSPDFTLASVCGDYGIVGVYGANIARALGTATMDGRGKLTGSAIVNQPGPNNTRTIVAIGLAATYTLNADGSGIMVFTVTLPNRSSANVTEDFVITKSKVVDGKLIASEIQDAQEVPSAVIEDSSLVIHTYTLRRPAKACAEEH